jgi:hypothetical protein
MALQLQGVGGVVAEVDGTTFRAVRTTPRPLEYGAFGAFVFGGITGILPAALGANSEIFQFRWADATRLAVIRKIRIAASVTTTMFAAGVPVQIDLVKSITWSAPGTGGTGITMAALLKRRTSMANSLMAAGDMRIATTAALGAGTKVLETLSLSTLLSGGPITASLNGTIFAPGTLLWQAEVGDGEHPLVLAQNEGFSIRSVAVPATGTWMAAINVDWTEVSAY